MWLITGMNCHCRAVGLWVVGKIKVSNNFGKMEVGNKNQDNYFSARLKRLMTIGLKSDENLVKRSKEN